MKQINRDITKYEERPIRVLQYGEGNFLRGFVDYMLDMANEKNIFNGNIAIVKPIAYGNLDAFHEQQCQYTLSLRGKEQGDVKVINRVITSVADAVDCVNEYEKYSQYAKLDSLRFIVSNTTEAGITYDEKDQISFCPPITYPGKLTKLLYERYLHYKGDVLKGLVILPVELIDDNGKELKKCVFKYANDWKLGDDFLQWLEEACCFCSTLVDRIITGYPRSEEEQFFQELGYQDKLLDTGELFALWVIESEKPIEDELPLNKIGLPVIFTDNQKPYKERKVRILNGAHTSFVLASFLAGNDYVGESMKDELILNFMKATVFDEIIPTLSLKKEDCIAFANAVIERFENPFIKHSLLAISLNSVSKWRARCMPSLIGYVNQFQQIPKHLAFSLAALIEFYSSKEYKEGALIGKRFKEQDTQEEYKIVDEEKVLRFFEEYSDTDIETFTKSFLSKVEFFGQDLTLIKDLESTVVADLKRIRKDGMREAIKCITI